MAAAPTGVGTGAAPDAGDDFARALGELGRALTFGIHPSLAGIRALTDALGRPQDAFASIQVTGTNGKSSVTRLIAAILKGEGQLVGAYTSPHLVSYTERIEVDGMPVSETEFARAVLTVARAASGLADERGAALEFTEFELLTAAALWVFRQRSADSAVLEVGMGGRWDATSVVCPVVAVITGVGLDHTERLGDTVEEIAFDKAHVIKPASAPVLGPGTAEVADILLARATEMGTCPRFVAETHAPSPLSGEVTVRFRVTDYPAALGGDLGLEVRGLCGRYPGLRLRAPLYQAPNVAVAVAAAEAAVGRALDGEALRESLAATVFPGRFEVVRTDPPLVLDGAHNPQAAAVLASAIDEAFGRQRPVALLGVLADKDALGIVAALAGHVAGFIASQPSSPRALSARDLGALVERTTGQPCPAYPELGDALVAAERWAAGAVVTGSLYTVGQVREMLSDAPG